MRRLFVVMCVIGFVLAPATSARADTVTATGTHDFADAFGGAGGDTIVEVIEDRVEISFDPRGGPFTGTGFILYRHTISNEFCELGVYETPTEIFYEGVFNPADNNMFYGRVEIVTGPTSQDPGCPDFGYSYNGPIETVWPFTAQLDPRSGHLTELTGFYGAVADTDPSALVLPPSPVGWHVGTFDGFQVGDVLSEGDDVATVVESGLVFQFPVGDTGMVTGTGTAAVHHVISEEGSVVCQWTVIDEILFHGFLDDLGAFSGAATVTPGQDVSPDCGVEVPAPADPSTIDIDGTFDGSALIIRENVLTVNQTSGMTVRGEELGLDGVVDDVDITHTLTIGTDQAVQDFADIGFVAIPTADSGVFYIADSGELTGGMASIGIEATDGTFDILSWSDYLFGDGMVFHVTRSTVFQDGAIVDFEIVEHPPQPFDVDLSTGMGMITVNEDGLQYPIAFDPFVPVAGTADDGSVSDDTSTTLPGGPADPFAPSDEGSSADEGGGISIFLIISGIIAALGAGAYWINRGRGATQPVADSPPAGKGAAEDPPIDSCVQKHADWQELERQCAEAREGLEKAKGQLDATGDSDMWQSSVDEWQEMVDDYCRRAADAKRAYDECVEEQRRAAQPKAPKKPLYEEPELEPVPPFVPGPAEGEDEPVEDEPEVVEETPPPPPRRTRSRECTESDPPREKNKRTMKVTIPSGFQPVLLGGDFHEAEVDSLGLVEELRQTEIVSHSVANILKLAPAASRAQELKIGTPASVVAGGVKFAADYSRVLLAGAAAIIEKWMEHYGGMPDNEVMITWKRIPYELSCVEVWKCRDGRWTHDHNRFTAERTGSGQAVRTRLTSGLTHQQAIEHINTYGAKFKAELELALEKYDAFAKGCASR